MSDSEWEKIEFQEFINQYGKEIILQEAPKILYSKKDKEHESFGSLIAAFLIAGFVLIYCAISLFIIEFFFSPILFGIIVSLGIIVTVVLIIYYVKSSVTIKPIECWIEIFKGISQNGRDFYCFSYYPVYSGKVHPNKAINIIFKLYQDHVLKSKIDITQIEKYVSINSENSSDMNKVGYFFQYGEGKAFDAEDIDRRVWKFFKTEKELNQNYLATANWDHQYEWRDDLELDFDKLHRYAPWIIQSWNEDNLKPLTEEYKKKLNWELRTVESFPKLEPWKGNIHEQQYNDYTAFKDIQIVNQAIEKVMGSDVEIKKYTDIKKNLQEFNALFRDISYNYMKKL